MIFASWKDRNSIYGFDLTGKKSQFFSLSLSLNLFQEFDSSEQVIVLKEVLNGAKGVVEEGLHRPMLVLDHAGEAVRLVRVDLLPGHGQANQSIVTKSVINSKSSTAVSCSKHINQSEPEDYLVADKGLGKEHGVLNMHIVVSRTMDQQETAEKYFKIIFQINQASW